MAGASNGYRGLAEQRPELELLPISRTLSSSPEPLDGPAPGLLTRARWTWRDAKSGLYVRHSRTRRHAMIVGAGAAMLIAVALIIGLVSSVQQDSPSSSAAETGASNADLCTFQQGEVTQLPPDMVSPLGYSLLLHLHADHFVAGPSAAVEQGFAGQCNITLAAHQATRCVALHASGLTFTRVAASLVLLQDGSQACLCGPDPGCGSSSCSTTVTAAAGTPDVVLVHLGALTAPAGSTLLLQFAYTAQFGSGSGLWRSTAFGGSSPAQPGSGQPGVDAAAQQEVLLTTQFETIGARTVLPCFDEPSFKAPFAVAVDAPPGITVLSNGALQSLGPSPLAHHHIRHTFEPSPVMSSYLLALAAGHMGALSAVSSSGKNVSIWSVPGKQSQARMALTAALGALSHYEAISGIVLPLSKFDLVAVPGKAGAMENFGLLIFDDDRLLFNAASEGAWDLWRCADVVCHEMAHQWFGNLVTAHAWADLTVNEGAASYHEYGCLAASFPQLTPGLLMARAMTPLGQHVGVHEGVQHQARLAGEDPGATPLMPPPGTAVTPVFGAIAYSVGASLLAMLSSTLDGGAGQASSTFQSVMSAYLHARAFSTATTQQLFGGLAAQLPNALLPDGTNNDVILDAWLTQPGYPVLLLEDASQEAGSAKVSHQQRRFCSWGVLLDSLLRQLTPDSISLPAPGNLICPGNGTAWWLPLPFAASLDAAGSEIWLVTSAAQGVLELPAAAAAASAWSLQGAGAHGMFRVRYGPQQRKALRAAVLQLQLKDYSSASSVLILRQAGAVVDDQLALALSPFGEVPGREVLDVVWAGVRSQAALGSGSGRYALLLPVLDALETLGDRLQQRHSCWAKLQAYTVTLLTPHVTATLNQLAGNLSTAAHSPTALNEPPLNETPDAFFGRLLQSRLLLTAALAGDQKAAAFLCSAFTTYTNAAAVVAGGSSGVAFQTWLDPDVADAAFAAAAAQPPGCDLGTLTGLDIWQVLASTAATANAAGNPALASRAFFALAHTRDMVLCNATLQAVVLGSGSNDPDSRQLLGWTSGMAADVALVLIRSAYEMEQSGASADGTSLRAGAILTQLVEGLTRASSVLGEGAAWELLERAAAATVTTPEGWRQLAQQLLLQRQQQPGAAEAAGSLQELRVSRVLSRAWSSVQWMQENGDSVCEAMPG